MADTAELPTDAVLTVTDKARSRVVELLDDQDDPEADALWIEILGERAGEFAYDLYFQGRRHADPGDAVVEHDDLTVVVPADSVRGLVGATLDVSRDLLNPGLKLDNPNRPTPPSGAASPTIEDQPLELSGTVAERVVQVLEQRINPSIAGHGGRADLVGVQDGVVSLRLSGGCQGCGMAAATLRNGIEVRLREAIPEITEIVDVTDHDAGEDPYY
ncbi:MAG: NifU family protein [Actinomycetota bacterium]